MLVVLRENQTQ